MITTVLIVVLVLACLGVVPVFPAGAGAGVVPLGMLAVVLLAVLVLLLTHAL